MSEAVVCRSTRYGEGCFHPVSEHIGSSTCCCCSGRHNDVRHVQTCLDCSIQHAKHTVRREQGKSVPLVYDVEPLIPEDLKRAFWQRYVGKSFDKAMETP